MIVSLLFFSAMMINILNMAIDPNGFEEIVDYYTILLFQYLSFVLYFWIYVFKLMQWRRFYLVALKKVQMTNMIRRINKNFKEEATIDQVIESTRVLGYSNLPLIGVCCAHLIITLLISIIKDHSMIIIYVVTSTLSWMTLVVGFYIYANRIVVYLPSGLEKKVRRVERRIYLVGCVSVVNHLVFSVLGIALSFMEKAILAEIVLLSINHIIMCYAISSKFFMLNPEFPFVQFVPSVFDGQESTSDTSGAVQQNGSLVLTA
jgi:hypothetical protein